jgi:hypothetical protein
MLVDLKIFLNAVNAINAVKHLILIPEKKFWHKRHPHAVRHGGVF